MEAFYPWVGSNYSKSNIFNKKVFVLGESIYCEDPEDCGGCYPGAINLCNYLQIHIVLENMLGNISTPLYTKIYKLLADENITSKQVFWNSISFGNFVQTSVANKARVRPSEDMWELSKNIFIKTLSRLEPDKIIVLGNELWENLPGIYNIDWIPITNNKDVGYSEFKCRLIDKEIDAAILGHPQRFGFDYSEKQLIDNFLHN